MQETEPIIDEQPPKVDQSISAEKFMPRMTFQSHETDKVPQQVTKTDRESSMQSQERGDARSVQQAASDELHETIATVDQFMSPGIHAEFKAEDSQGSQETIQSKSKPRRTTKRGKVVLQGPQRNLQLTANSLISQ